MERIVVVQMHVKIQLIVSTTRIMRQGKEYAGWVGILTFLPLLWELAASGVFSIGTYAWLHYASWQYILGRSMSDLKWRSYFSYQKS